jgi:PKD repeat protein
VDEGQTLEFRVSSTDPDGDALTLTAENVPANAVFVDSGNGAGSFTFNPTYTQSGLYNVTFITSDGSLADSELVSITVNESGNQVPVLDSIGSKTVAETETLEFRIHATDPDGDVMTLSAEDVPTNASFMDSGNGAGSFTFNPDYDQAGTFNVTFIASDGSLADSETVEVTVTNTNRAPVLDSIGSRTVIEGGHLGFVVSASDLDADILTLTAENAPLNATFIDSGNGKGLFEFDPDYTQSGLHYITFKVTDGDLVDSEVVEITVIEAGNQFPVLDSIGPQTVAETETLIFKVSATDPDGNTPALMAFNWPANSAFVDSGNGNGSFSFYPNYDQGGIYTVGFVATDGFLADTEMVEITVTETNRLPVLDSIGSRIVTEGQTLEFRISATDPDEDVLILSAENMPANASLTDSGNGAGSFTFNPDYTQSGLYYVTFIASDGSLADSEIVEIAVNEVGNQAPVLDSIGSKSVDEGQTLEFKVSATDPDGDSITLTAENVPINASFVDSGNGAGSFTFNPDYDQAGSYNVVFITSDGSLADSELVAITVNDVNQAPVLDSIGTKIVNEGQTLEFRASASDPDGDAITLSAENIPTNASFVDSGNGAGSFTFNPDYTQSGLYNVIFIASDGLLEDSELVSITVNEVGNHAPILDSIGSKSVDEGQSLEFRVYSTDPDGDAITLSTDSIPSNSAFVDSGNGAGSFTFNPDYTQAGTYNITYIASDGSLADSELVQITVDHINQAPLLDSIGSKIVQEGQTLEFRFSASDPDGDGVTLTVDSIPSNASFVDSGNGAGSFTFNPDYTQSGLYNVIFVASDGLLADSESVSISVNEAGNQAPVLDSIGARAVDEGQTLEFRVSASDPDFDSIILTAENTPLNASFVDSGNGAGSFTFNPDYDQAGAHNVIFIASDGILADSESVSIMVNDVNRAPVLDSIGSKVVQEGQTLEFRISAIDPDGDAVTLTAADIPTNASFVDSGNGAGSFTFDPDYTQSGLYTVTFKASDGILPDSEIVSITVNEAGNQSPVLDSIGSKSVDESQSLEFRVYSTDPDGDAITLSIDSIPSNASFVDSGNGAGSFTFNPDYTQAGTYNLTFIASDGSLADSELVVIVVNDINQAPVLDSIGSKIVEEGQTLEFRVSATDLDGDAMVLSADSIPLNASFVDSGNGAGSFSFDPTYTQSGSYNVVFTASDGLLADSESVSISVNEAGNQAPVLDSIGSRSTQEGQTLEFRIFASDLDNDSLILSAVDIPANATLVDSGNGAGSFTFNPDYIQAGIYNVTFIASDGFIDDSELVEITVSEAGNQAPVIDSIGPQIIDEGNTLSIVMKASDPDNDSLLLSVSNQPSNSTFIDSGNGTGLFTFTPDFYQSGVDTVSFLAMEKKENPLSDFENVIITIIDINQPPVFDSIGPQNVAVYETLSIRVVGTDPTDPDGGALHLSALPLPLNSTFTDSGGGIGGFVFAPDTSQLGTDTVIFYCSDEGDPPATGQEMVIITVQEGANQAPILESIGSHMVVEAETLSFTVSASDPNGTIPILYTSPLPINATFVDSGNGRGLFTFAPDYSQQGLKEITFYASDGELVDNEDVLIQVTDAGNQMPGLDSIGAKSVTEGDTLIFSISATDPDSTIPELYAENLPINANFVDNAIGSGVFTFTPVYVQSGTYDIIFFAYDGELADSEVVQITVNDAGNQTPVMTFVDSQVVEEGQQLVVNIQAIDPDSTIPFLRAWNVPDNATFTDIGDGNGTLEFNPSYFQAGVDTVIFEAVDYEDSLVKVNQSVQITVQNLNRLPVFQQVSTQELDEGDTLIFNVIATDPDSTFPTLFCTPKPQNSTFFDSGNGVGTFSFYPAYFQSGTIYPMFFAIDNEFPAEPETASMQVQIIVYDVPQPPEWSDIPDTFVTEGDTLILEVSASDPDGISPVLSALGLPFNSSFVDNENGTGTFTFAPDFVQAGTSWVSFIATDITSMADTEAVQIIVTESGNQAPVLLPIQTEWTIPAIYGDSFVVSAADPDSTIPVLTAAQLPNNASFYDSGNGVGLFTFIPDTTQADSVYEIIFIVSDGFLADSQAVICSVIAYTRGDANGDTEVSIADAVYLINYLFNEGPAPVPWGAGDANGDGNVSIVDAVYLVNYLFNDGPPPPKIEWMGIGSGENDKSKWENLGN